jgi:hypothetical protein
MSKRQYRLALHDEHGAVIEGAQYAHVSERTPQPGDRIELPGGAWIVDEVVATFSGDERSRLVDMDGYGGTLICRPAAPGHDPGV